MKKESPQPVGLEAALLATLVGVLRGGNQVALKFALVAFSPLWSAGARMSIAIVCVGLWCRVRKIDLRPVEGEWRRILILGALFTVQIGLLHIGADFTSPAYAVILINANPIFTNLVSHFVVPEDRLNLPRVIGLLVAFIGICTVFLERPEARLAGNPLLGNALILLSSALVGVRLVYIQRIVQTMDPSKAAFWQMFLSIPCFGVAGWFFGGALRSTPTWEPITAILYQGIVIGSLSMIIWLWLLRKHTPGSISAFTFAVPFFGLLLSAWLFAEQLTLRLFWGLLLVIAGIWLVTRKGRSRAPAAVDDSL